MFTKKSPAENSGLEDAIDNLFAQMNDVPSHTPEYAAMTDQMTKLYALKDLDRPARVSPDTLAIVAANLTGIVMIVGHERAHIVTSKALSFLLKLR